uniref:Uncharacterized protein n=1 Tax=Opuntia streptacantha TaxID=393608 RepID=A0A7C9ADY2_OPUST
MIKSSSNMHTGQDFRIGMKRKKLHPLGLIKPIIPFCCVDSSSSSSDLGCLNTPVTMLPKDLNGWVRYRLSFNKREISEICHATVTTIRAETNHWVVLFCFFKFSSSLTTSSSLSSTSPPDALVSPVFFISASSSAVSEGT